MVTAPTKISNPLKETFGVWVLVQDREHPANGATQLLEALHACGIEAQGIEVSGPGPRII
jgi:hypothetical protein